MFTTMRWLFVYCYHYLAKQQRRTEAWEQGRSGRGLATAIFFSCRLSLAFSLLWRCSFFNYKSAINVTRKTMRKSVRRKSGGGAGQDRPGKVVKAVRRAEFFMRRAPPRGFAPLSRVAHEAFNKHQVRTRPGRGRGRAGGWSVLLLSRCSLF